MLLGCKIAHTSNKEEPKKKENFIMCIKLRWLMEIKPVNMVFGQMDKDQKKSQHRKPQHDFKWLWQNYGRNRYIYPYEWRI